MYKSFIADIKGQEFRIRFNPQTWANKIDMPQVLIDQKLSDAVSVQPQTDYCAWRPAATGLGRLLSDEPESEAAYTIRTSDREPASPVTIAFEIKTYNGFRLGTLQCFFPQATSAESISFDQWVALVGGHLTLEVNP